MDPALWQTTSEFKQLPMQNVASIGSEQQKILQQSFDLSNPDLLKTLKDDPTLGYGYTPGFTKKNSI